jgi:phosphoribosylamine--glycine ligase
MPTRVLIVGAVAASTPLPGSSPGARRHEIVVAPGSAGWPRPACGPPGIDLDPRRSSPQPAIAAGSSSSARGALAAGVADALRAAGIPVLGPDREAARLETSKAFCHEVAAAAGVRMARSGAYAGGEAEAAIAFVRELAAEGAGAVLKADGLAAGKGVIVTESAEQAVELAPSFLAGRPGGVPALVVEERLRGPEASVIAVCDGTRAVALPAARDHKRLCDGDRGPNTGGMGAYSPLPTSTAPSGTV